MGVADQSTGPHKRKNLKGKWGGGKNIQDAFYGGRQTGNEQNVVLSQNIKVVTPQDRENHQAGQTWK